MYVVEEQPRADLQSRSEVPPIENRVRESMGAVEQGEIELSVSARGSTSCE